jgi:ribosomal protein S3
MYWFTPVFSNIKICIRGCIADSERTRSIIIGQNSVTTQTFNKRVDYAITHAATPFGALGIKI